MKTRFSSIDIRTTVHNLQKNVIGLRLANIYDLSPRVFLLKLSRPDFKKTLIIESGIRIHSTNFIRDKGDHTPAPFSITLRKYLKTKRLESVRQLGVDRIVDFTFGSGIATQHVIVELFSIGNIILTDGDYKVLAILRTHQYTENDNIAVGDVYPVEKAKQPSVFTEALVDNIIQQATDKKDTLKQVFNKSLDFGPELIEHCILMAGLSPSLKIESYNHEEHAAKLIQAFKEGQKIFDVAVQSKGFIVLRPPKQESKQQQQQKKKQQAAATAAAASLGEKKEGEEGEEKKELVVYEEFVPYLYKQYQDKKYLEFDSFDLAVDQFFSEIESQKVEQQRLAQEQTVLKKLDKVREDQQRRIDSLYASETENIKKAQLIEANLQDVDQCILIIRSGVAASMDWGNLNQLLKEEKKKNPYSVATKIHKLKLETNQITLSLTDLHLDDDYDEDDDEENSDEDDEDVKKKNQKKNTKKPVMVDVDISLSAYANARSYYDSKKQSHEKAEKTIHQADFALKAAEKKARQQLSEVKTKSSMQQMRKVFWFEKFHWFISSDNYIVISGKDAQQNELLFKKYLEKDDIYVHADIFGSTSCVIKNPKGGEIPPNTLIQAGTMTMCYSNAWSAKVVTSAYWVYSHQVSKTAPSGEYLTTGSFMIRGKKNYLPHSQLVMGFGFMFKIDDSCIANHLGERSSGSSLLRDSMDSSVDQDERMEELPEESGGKHLRKFERTKLKKEKEDEKFMEMDGMQVSEDLAKLSVNDSSATTTTTTTTTSTPPTQDKYKIKLVGSYVDDDDEDEEEETTAQEEGEKGSKKTKAYVTAAERRKMKKEKSAKKDDDEEYTITNQQPAPPKKEVVQEEKEEKQPKKKVSEPQKHLTPSQKNKLKKIQEKYGHQDEEERQLAMELLGSAGSKKEKKKDKKDKKDKKNNKNQQQQQKGGKQQQQSTNVAKKETITETKPIEKQEEEKIVEKKQDEDKEKLNVVEEKKKEIQDISDNDDDDDDESDEEEGEEGSQLSEEAKEKKRKSRKEKREEKLKEQEEIKKLLEEENESTMKLDDNIFSNIDTLTGNPLENDILHFAIPVVGPYSIFNNYKFKVKLTPGHQKRGKAAKQAAATLLSLKNISNREKELIKNIKDEDLSANMLADVRLHAPNLLATKKKEKAEKKAKATERFNEEQQAKKEKQENNKDSNANTSTTTTTTTNTNNKDKKDNNKK